MRACMILNAQLAFSMALLMQAGIFWLHAKKQLRATGSMPAMPLSPLSVPALANVHMMAAEGYGHLRESSPETEFGQSHGELRTRRCPACGWMDTRLSLTHTLLDNILGLVGLVPYRCRTCGDRFYRTRFSRPRRKNVIKGT
jgi:hypothetical protein